MLTHEPPGAKPQQNNMGDDVWKVNAGFFDMTADARKVEPDLEKAVCDVRDMKLDPGKVAVDLFWVIGLLNFEKKGQIGVI